MEEQLVGMPALTSSHGCGCGNSHPTEPVKQELSGAALPAKTELAVNALQVVQEANERVEHAQQALRAAALRHPKGTFQLRMQAHAMALEAQRAANTHLQECLALEEAEEDAVRGSHCVPTVKQEPQWESDSDDSLGSLVPDVPDWKLKPSPDHFIPAPRTSCKAEPLVPCGPAPDAVSVRRKPCKNEFTLQREASKTERLASCRNTPPARRALENCPTLPLRRTCKIEPTTSPRARSTISGRLSYFSPPVVRPSCKSEPSTMLGRQCKVEPSAAWSTASAAAMVPAEEDEDVARPSKYRRFHCGNGCAPRQLEILRKTQTFCDWDPARYPPERVMSKWGHLLQFLPPEDF